eukprot:3044215-Alexandrium_andersonii.AAC.1
MLLRARPHALLARRAACPAGAVGRCPPPAFVWQRLPGCSLSMAALHGPQVARPRTPPSTGRLLLALCRTAAC